MTIDTIIIVLLLLAVIALIAAMLIKNGNGKASAEAVREEYERRMTEMERRFTERDRQNAEASEARFKALAEESLRIQSNQIRRTNSEQITKLRSLALELAPSGIRVNCVAPGVIDTDMVQVLGQETLRDLAEQTPLGRLGTPEDVAHAVAFFASEGASFVTGQILSADGGFIV